MSKATDLQFRESIKEIFGSVFKDYSFELQGESLWDGHGEYFVTATHGDIALNFYLSVTPLSPVCYCTLAIMLTGKLAEKATSNKRKSHTGVDVMVIAERLDPDYKRPPGRIQTNQDLKEILEKEKECLLTYCQSILLGDVSIILKVVEELDEQARKSGIKIEGQD